MLDALLCRNWPFLSTHSETLTLTNIQKIQVPKVWSLSVKLSTSTVKVWIPRAKVWIPDVAYLKYFYDLHDVIFGWHFYTKKNPLKWVAGFGSLVGGWKAFCHQWKLTKHRQHKKEQPQKTFGTIFEGTGTHESQREKNNNIYKDKNFIWKKL